MEHLKRAVSYRAAVVIASLMSRRTSLDVRNERCYGDFVTNPINVWPKKIVERVV